MRLEVLIITDKEVKVIPRHYRKGRAEAVSRSFLIYHKEE